MANCEFHGTPKRTEPLTRFDGTQIGSLTLGVCDQCDAKVDANFKAFIDHVLTGELGDQETETPK